MHDSIHLSSNSYYNSDITLMKVLYPYLHIPYMQKFSPILPPALIGENFITLHFCPVLKIA